jgi:hypothetical protein
VLVQGLDAFSSGPPGHVQEVLDPVERTQRFAVQALCDVDFVGAELQPSVEAISPNAAHVLRAGIAYREATLRWLDSLPWAGKRQAASGAKGQRTRRSPKDTAT